MDRAKRKLIEALQAIDVLEAAGFEARMAGGCVRDRLLGVEPRDYDVATNAPPDQVCKVFAKAKIKVVPTGFDHGTVTLVLPAGPVEVTTLRIDLETYGRHATVALGTSFKEDAARRDFTINAMFEDKQGTVLDYFNGQNDLKNRVLRFVGVPETRIQEDYLRIMRLFRFWSRFDFKPAPGTLEAIVANRDGLLQISQERITYELHRIFVSPVISEIFQAMRSTGVLAVILPELSELNENEINLPESAALKVLQQIEDIGDRSVAVFSLLLFVNQMDSSERIKALTTRLRFSKNDIRKACLLAALFQKLPQLHAKNSEHMDFLDHCDEVFAAGDSWHQVLKHYISALAAQVKNSSQVSYSELLLKLDALEKEKSHLRKADLPISTTQMISMFNLKPGPEVGELLEELRAAFRNGDWFSKPEGEAWLRKQVSVRNLKK